MRVRLAAVPGTADSAAVQQMVALFSRGLGRASTATLQVWGVREGSLMETLDLTDL